MRLSSYYTLDGVKLDKRPTRKGMYIYNGKKIVITRTERNNLPFFVSSCLVCNRERITWYDWSYKGQGWGL